MKYFHIVNNASGLIIFFRVNVSFDIEAKSLYVHSMHLLFTEIFWFIYSLLVSSKIVHANSQRRSGVHLSTDVE